MSQPHLHLPVLEVDVHSGLLCGVRWVESPNRDARPVGCPLDLIVIHGISLPPGVYGGPWIDQLFTNRLDGDQHPYFDEVRALRVSSHVLLARDGGITQYVRFQDRAWHAGMSSYAGREACNDFSIGIELEGTIPRPTRTCSTVCSQTSSPRCSRRIRRCPWTGSPGMRTLHPDARPIPALPSTGRVRAGS